MVRGGIEAAQGGFPRGGLAISSLASGEESPIVKSSMGSPTQSYRCRFSTLFLWFLGALLILDILRMWILKGVPLEEIELFHNLNLITLVSFFSSLVLVWIFKSEISPEGITSYNYLGGKTFFQWREIKEASKRNILGLGYFRIVNQNGDSIYVARYLSRQREFEAIVSAITDKNNPLHRCIVSKKNGDKN